MVVWIVRLLFSMIHWDITHLPANVVGVEWGFAGAGHVICSCTLYENQRSNSEVMFEPPARKLGRFVKVRNIIFQHLKGLIFPGVPPKWWVLLLAFL